MSTRTCALCKRPVLRRDGPACTCVDCGEIVHELCIPNPAHIANGKTSCAGHTCISASARDSSAPPSKNTAAARYLKRQKATPTGATVSSLQPVAPSTKRLASPPSPSSESAAKQHRVAVSRGRSLSASDCASVTPSLGVAADNMGDSDEAPRWFQRFLDEFHTLQSSVQEFHSSINQRIDNVEAQLATQLAAQETRAIERDSALRTDLRTEFRNDISNEIRSLRSELTGSAQPAVPSLTPAHEEFEVLVTGIPHSLHIDNSEFVRLLLNFLGLSHLLNFVIGTRTWLGNRNSSEEAPSNSSGSLGIVISCSSTIVRDKITAAAVRLRDARCSAIFGGGGDASIFLRALWPKPTYELYRKAIIRCRAINYAHPFIRNGFVWVKSSAEATPVPIRSEIELQALKPALN